MIIAGMGRATETGDVKGPPLRNRTVLALAEVVSACFDFTINLGGNFEPRVRPDWFADFLYRDEFPASLIQRARQLQPLADDAYLLDAIEEDVGRGEQGEVGVVVGVIVPAEERREPAAGVQLAGEAARIVGLVLQRLELLSDVDESHTSVHAPPLTCS